MTRPDGPDRADLESVARTLLESDLAVALTGAGVSTESGIPDFRSEGGIWEEYDERDFSVGRFHADPDGFWRDWLDLRSALIPETAAPNPAHESLAALESAGHLHGVVTQNVDGLHQRAGSATVIEIHGNGDRAACRGCDASFDAATASERARDTGEAPRCENCGGVLKPDAVLFGERLPDIPLRESQRLARDCDAMLVVGSSLTVDPAGQLPRRAADTGATLAVVNREPTPVRDRADHVFRDDASEVVPEIAAAVARLQ